MFDIVVLLLMPYCKTKKQRQRLLKRAFANHPDIRAKIADSNNHRTFTIWLIDTLRAHGEIAPGIQALWHVLLMLKSQAKVGDDLREQIDLVEAWANASPERMLRPDEDPPTTAGIRTGSVAGGNVNIGGTQVFHGDVHIQGAEPPALPPAAPFMMEDLPEGFVKRPREFEAVLQAMIVPRDGEVSLNVAIIGAGGYGKTTLALDVCRDARVRNNFQRGILWITIGEKMSENDLVAKTLDLVVRLTGSRPPVVMLKGAQDALKEAIGDQPILLVVDDVWKAEHLAPFMNLGPQAATLITTRNGSILPPRLHAYVIDAMQPSEAVALLGAGLNGAIAHELDLTVLSTHLGKWPLLLKLVNGQLSRRMAQKQTLMQALDWVVAALQERGFEAFKNPSDPNERHRAAAASLDVSLNLLVGIERARFERLAIFPEDVDVSLSVLEKLWNITRLEVEALAEHLMGLSLLLKYDLNAGVIRLHDVVRTYLRERHKVELTLWNRQFLEMYHVNTWHELALSEADQQAVLRNLLRHHVSLQGRLGATWINALLQDYALAKVEKDEAIYWIESALFMSKHILSEDKTALAHQLVGRLMSYRKRNNQIRIFTDALMASTESLYPLDLDSESVVLNQAGGVLLRQLTGHAHNINYIALTADEHMISASSDGALIVWDLETGSHLYTLWGHTRSVKHVALVNNNCAISASDDNTLILWDLETGLALDTLSGHRSGVTHVASVGTNRAVSASYDHTLIVWDLATGEALHRLEGHHSGVIHAVVTNDGHIVSASDDHTLKVWDHQTGALLRDLVGHTNGVTHVALIGKDRAVSSSYDHTLIVWDPATGKMLHRLEGHKSGVAYVRVINRDRAISASDDSTLIVWNLNTGQAVHILQGHTHRVNHVTLIDDEHAISASEDRTLIVWNLTTGQALYRLVGHASAVNHVILTRSGWAVSASDDGRLIVWNIEMLPTDSPSSMSLHSAENIREPFLRAYANSVMHIIVTDDGRAVSMSGDETLVVWDLATGMQLRTLQGHTDGVNAVVLTNDGRAVSGSSDRTLMVWDLDSGAREHILSGHGNWINSIALWGKDYAISASYDHTLIVWDLENGAPRHILGEHARSVNHVAVTDDGRAVSASEDGSLMLWNLETGRHLGTLWGHTRGVNHVVVTGDSRAVSASKDSHVMIWDLESGKALSTLRGHTRGVNHVSLTGQGRLISTDSDEIIVWDLETGNMLGQFENTLQRRTDLLRLFPDVTAFEGFVRHATGYGLLWIDNTLSVNAANGNPLSTFYGDHTITIAAWSPDGKTIIVGDSVGHIFFLRIRLNQPVDPLIE